MTVTCYLKQPVCFFTIGSCGLIPPISMNQTSKCSKKTIFFIIITLKFIDSLEHNLTVKRYPTKIH